MSFNFLKFLLLKVGALCILITHKISNKRFRLTAHQGKCIRNSALKLVSGGAKREGQTRDIITE